jgi:hypothetical protein
MSTKAFKEVIKATIVSIATNGEYVTMDLVDKRNKLFSCWCDLPRRVVEHGTKSLHHKIGEDILEQLVMKNIFQMFFTEDGLLYIMVQDEHKNETYVEINPFSRTIRSLNGEEASIVVTEHRAEQF